MKYFDISNKENEEFQKTNNIIYLGNEGYRERNPRFLLLWCGI